jgi:hypothetical protein
MYSKCIFGNGNKKHSMVNPLGEQQIPHIFDKKHTEFFNQLENKYTNPLSSKSYDNIENDILQYSELHSKISNIEFNSKNTKMKLLFKISLQGLAGAIHAFQLNTQNIELNLENLYLKNKIETIFSNKNLKLVNEMDTKMSIVKKFTLAPLYSYYIVLFGIPSEKGFEQSKLNQIIQFMKKYNIDF